MFTQKKGYWCPWSPEPEKMASSMHFFKISWPSWSCQYLSVSRLVLLCHFNTLKIKFTHCFQGSFIMQITQNLLLEYAFLTKPLVCRLLPLCYGLNSFLYPWIKQACFPEKTDNIDPNKGVKSFIILLRETIKCHHLRNNQMGL